MVIDIFFSKKLYVRQWKVHDLRKDSFEKKLYTSVHHGPPIPNQLNWNHVKTTVPVPGVTVLSKEAQDWGGTIGAWWWVGVSAWAWWEN